MSEQWKQSVTVSIYTTSDKTLRTQPYSLMDNFDLRFVHSKCTKYNISSQQTTTKEIYILGMMKTKTETLAPKNLKLNYIIIYF